MKGNRTSSLRSGPGRIWPLADLANVRSPGRASTFASDPFRSFSVSIISWNVHADVETRCKSVAGDALPTGSPGRLSDTQNGDDMKFALAAAMALIGCLVGFNSANAQGAAMKTTPTTKILAIGTINPGFEQSQVFAVLPEEVRETVTSMARSSSGTHYRESRAWRSSSTSPIRRSLTKCSKSCLWVKHI